MESKQEFKMISLKDITIGSANPRKEFDERSIMELAHSIKEKGMLQPLVVRANGKPGKFELVCGERRYRASKTLSMETVPAIVRVLTDEEAFDLMITENLQRKDVHPLEEAIAFKALVEKQKLSITEIALRFGKSEKYVAGRLKLNDLIPELQKMFFAGSLHLGPALHLARIQSENQKDFLKDKAWQIKQIGITSAIEVAKWVENNIICNLSSAPFKKDDAALLPEAGACAVCPKRTGANPTLFPDIKEQDRCTDPTCFSKKIAVHAAKRAEEIISEDPDIYFLFDRHSEKNPSLEKLAKEHGIKILNTYDDFTAYGISNKEVKSLPKGFWINGDDTGKLVPIRLYKKSSSDKKEEKAKAKNPVKFEIEGIKKRHERAIELDSEKVYARILEEMRKGIKLGKAISEAENVCLWWLLIDKAGYSPKVAKHLGIETNYASASKNFQKIYDRLTKLSAQEKSFIVRESLLHTHGGVSHTSVPGRFIRMIAAAHDVPIVQYEKEQAEIASKRKARVEQRLAGLQKQSKEKKPAKAAKKK